MNTPRLRPLTTLDFSDVIGKEERPVLVDFHAEWCPPCRAMAPVIDSVADAYADRAVVTTVDVDQAPELATRYGVHAIPTLIIFHRGEVVDRTTGIVSADALRKKLDALTTTNAAA